MKKFNPNSPPRKPAAPSEPRKPEEYYTQRQNIKELPLKIRIPVKEIWDSGAEYLYFEHDSDYDCSYSSVYLCVDEKLKNPQYDYQLLGYQKDFKKYEKKLVEYEVKMIAYQIELKAWKKMKKQYDKEVETQLKEKRRQTFEELKKEFEESSSV